MNILTVKSNFMSTFSLACQGSVTIMSLVNSNEVILLLTASCTVYMFFSTFVYTEYWSKNWHPLFYFVTVHNNPQIPLWNTVGICNVKLQGTSQLGNINNKMGWRFTSWEISDTFREFIFNIFVLWFVLWVFRCGHTVCIVIQLIQSECPNLLKVATLGQVGDKT